MNRIAPMFEEEQVKVWWMVDGGGGSM